MRRYRPGFSFATRLAVFYAAMILIFGVQLPFFPLWLKAKGLDAGMIGIVLAVPMLVRVFAIPIASRAADRRDALRTMIVTTSAATVIGYALVGLSEGTVMILIAYALASMAFTPVMPLADTYGLKGLAARKIAYGPVRLWGSAAFIAGSFAAGFAADSVPARQLIWLLVAATAVSALASLVLLPVTIAAPPLAPSKPLRPLLRDPVFLTVVAAASLIQGSHSVYYGFATLQWINAGLDGTVIAALWALGVVAEIVLFAFSARLPGPAVLLLLGAGGAVVRWSAMAIGPPALLLPFLQTLHALTFGATHLGAVGFVMRHAPPGQGATAQGYLAVALGAVMAAIMAVSGWLFAAYGNLAYAAMALVAAAGGACALYARFERAEPAH